MLAIFLIPFISILPHDLTVGPAAATATSHQITRLIYKNQLESRLLLEFQPFLSPNSSSVEKTSNFSLLSPLEFWLKSVAIVAIVKTDNWGRFVGFNAGMAAELLPEEQTRPKGANQ